MPSVKVATCWRDVERAHEKKGSRVVPREHEREGERCGKELPGRLAGRQIGSQQQPPKRSSGSHIQAGMPCLQLLALEHLRTEAGMPRLLLQNGLQGKQGRRECGRQEAHAAGCH